MFPLFVLQPCSHSNVAAVRPPLHDSSTDPGLTTLCICVCRWRGVVCVCVWGGCMCVCMVVLQKGQSGDGCFSRLCGWTLRLCPQGCYTHPVVFVLSHETGTFTDGGRLEDCVYSLGSSLSCPILSLYWFRSLQCPGLSWQCVVHCLPGRLGDWWRIIKYSIFCSVWSSLVVLW